MKYNYVGVQNCQAASLLFGGDVASPVPGGWYVNPTAFLATPGCRIEREEIFGPVLTLIGFDDLDDAIRIANDSAYGLGGGVSSGDVDRAMRIAKRVRTGTMSVNNGMSIAGDIPFGGYKASGYGREKGFEALYGFTVLKTVAVRHG